MLKKFKLLFAFCFVVVGSACTKSEGEHVYTLYSTNYPTDTGRSGIATFDLVTSEQAGVVCQEAADMYAEDFQKRKKINNWDESTKARYWCEKGRFKK